MSGKKSRNKGYIGEYNARKLLEKMGREVTWQAEDPNKPDLLVDGENIEVKYRASVPKCLYQWLEEKGADTLMIKRVNKKDGRSYPWLIVRKLDDEKKETGEKAR